MSMPSDLPPPDPSQRDQYEPEPTPARPAEYDRLRRILLGVGGAAMLVFAIGLGVFVLRDDGNDSRPEGATGTSPATATVVTTTAGTSVAPTTTAPATTVTTAAPSTSTTVAATTSTTAPPTTTPASTTTAAAEPATSSPAGAIRTAQSLMNALAAGRWNEARLLNPGRNESDSTLQSEYGPLVEASIVPATVTPLGDGRYDMRFGVVAHESEATGHQTSVLCSHWQVDVPDRTVDRISSARLRIETGYIDARTLASELSDVCARFPLK